MGIALSATCGFLLFVLLVLTILSSLPLSSSWSGNDVDNSDPSLELPTLAENLPIDNYSVITERPLFNQTRQPTPDGEGEDSEPLIDDSDFELPDIELSGVIITPSLRMVTLKRNDNEQSLVAFEGRPIEADFGTWIVSSIQPRAVTLTSDSGEELQLEMIVHDAQIEPPAPVSEPDEEEGLVAADAADQPTEVEPLSRAEEIRQRIAERREELRREADLEEQSETKAEKPDYKSAIQSMIGRNRQEKANNEDEK